jgi:hypothetical protein
LAIKPSIGIISCSKSDLSGLSRTLKSLNEIRDEINELVLVLSDYSESEIITITNQSRNLMPKIITSEPLGIYAAMNRGLKELGTEFALFLNGGDEIINSKSLSKLLDNMQGANWGYGSLEISTEESNVIRVHKFLPYSITRHRFSLNYVPHPSTILRRESILNKNCYNEKFTTAADQELILKFAIESSPRVIPEPIARFYLGGKSTRSEHEIVNDFQLISQNLFGYTLKSKTFDRILWKSIKSARIILSKIRSK